MSVSRNSGHTAGLTMAYGASMIGIVGLIAWYPPAWGFAPAVTVDGAGKVQKEGGVVMAADSGQRGAGQGPPGGTGPGSGMGATGGTGKGSPSGTGPGSGMGTTGTTEGTGNPGGAAAGGGAGSSRGGASTLGGGTSSGDGMGGSSAAGGGSGGGGGR